MNDFTRKVLVLGAAASVVCMANVSYGGVHTTGLSLQSTCADEANEGETIVCTVMLENQDNLHGVNISDLTTEFPFPGGLVIPITSCDADENEDGAFSLGAKDATNGSGPDFTTCSIEIPLWLVSCVSGVVATGARTVANGADAAFPILLVSASVFNGVDITCNLCGNLTLNGGEQCDDGNDNGGPASCCDSDCLFKANGSASCDGNACTRPDTCTDGVCSPGTCAHGLSCSLACGGTCTDTGSTCECGF